MTTATAPVLIELPTIYGMKSVNAFLLKGDEPTLVDCGEKTPASFEALRAGLRREGLELKDLQKIVITHAHVDHMGMAAQVAEASGAEASGAES